MRWVGLVGAALLVGCVGGDESTGKPQGSLGGPCFANDTCNAGLSCTLENGAGVCEQPDGTTIDAPSDGPQTNDATQDQTATDAPGDAPMDAPVDAGSDACGVTLAPETPCSTQCGGGTLCCPSDGLCKSGTATQCQSQCNGGATGCFQCIGKLQCNGESCCAVNGAVNPTCPAMLTIGGTVCESACGGQPVICTTASDCPLNHPCLGASVSGFDVTSIGVCQ